MNSETLQAARQAARLGQRPAWHDLARCAETDPEMFFPEKGESPGRPNGCAPDVKSGRTACKTPWTAVSGSACGAAGPNASGASWPASPTRCGAVPSTAR